MPQPSKPKPQTPARAVARDGAGAERADAAQGLHGRLLQVARLATIGEMAAGLAHELNQPLTAIANYANACKRLLGKAGCEVPELHEALHEIATQAVRAGDIVRRLRSVPGGRPSERAPANMNVVIGEIQELLQSDARTRGIRLSLELAKRLPPISIDAAQIQHVVLNLVHNAYDALTGAMSPAPEVRIRTGVTAQGDVEVAVCDNGPGLTPEALARLFDPFFSTKPSGTGLGLPISHTVIRAHGGRLDHEPNIPHGACFYIRLPLQAPG